MATLLVVDDDNHIRETLSQLFNPTHEVHTADRAEQALTFLEFETYDAIITDIDLPGLSGRDLLEHVHKTSPDTPVIVISGAFGPNDGPELQAAGAFTYFSKPFDLSEIEEAVEQALQRRQQVTLAGNGSLRALEASGER